MLALTVATVAFVTLGCKVNQVDSDTMRAHLTCKGFRCVEPADSPDVIVINSCAVTAESERKTRQKLRHFRTRYPKCIMVLTGCAVQITPNAAVKYPDADIVLSHQEALDLAHCIEEYMIHRNKVFDGQTLYCNKVFCSVNSPHKSVSRTRAYLKIEDGCNQFCSYCIIPHARGRVRSKPLDVIRNEIKTLVDQGFQEVVLVGINLAAYGLDLGCGLSDVIALLEEFSEIKRLRLGSLEPLCLTEGILETLSRVESFCPHFHISLQSGCDSVLKYMNRHYTSAEYFNLIKRVRTFFPDCAITTDIIVGFPGESDDDFEASLAFVRETGFSKVHVFPFSARKGTPAASFPGQIEKATKQARAKKMISLANELNHNFLSGLQEKTLAVLLEQPHPTGGMQGYTANYAHVIVTDAVPEQRNQILSVQITAVKRECCIGVLAR